MDYLDNPLPGSIAGADLRAAKKVRISTGVHSKLASRGFRPALLGAFAFLFIAAFSLTLIKLTG